MTNGAMSVGPPVLFIRDLQQSKTFYVDVLGFTSVHEDDTSVAIMMGEDMVLLVTVASATDMLMGETPDSPRGQKPSGMFNLFVDNVDAEYDRLSMDGVEFIIAPMDRYWGRRTAHFKDPDGFIWEISQSLE
ncbi:MAG TPA: VOC family protein [Acidimicrobiales bacterium]